MRPWLLSASVVRSKRQGYRFYGFWFGYSLRFSRIDERFLGRRLSRHVSREFIDSGENFNFDRWNIRPVRRFMGFHAPLTPMTHAEYTRASTPRDYINGASSIFACGRSVANPRFVKFVDLRFTISSYSY